MSFMGPRHHGLISDSGGGGGPIATGIGAMAIGTTFIVGSDEISALSIAATGLIEIDGLVPMAFSSIGSGIGAMTIGSTFIVG